MGKMLLGLLCGLFIPVVTYMFYKDKRYIRGKGVDSLPELLIVALVLGSIFSGIAFFVSIIGFFISPYIPILWLIAFLSDIVFAVLIRRHVVKSEYYRYKKVLEIIKEMKKQLDEIDTSDVTQKKTKETISLTIDELRKEANNILIGEKIKKLDNVIKKNPEVNTPHNFSQLKKEYGSTDTDKKDNLEEIEKFLSQFMNGDGDK